jgi:6-phosphogluconate dehydrogenase
MNMDIGLIGLGKMGSNMTTRLLEGGHRVVVFDLNEQVVHAAQSQGAEGVAAIEGFRGVLDAPRAVWVMVPAGDPTEETIRSLGSILEPGDLIIDGGNANYKDSIRRAEWLQGKGIAFLDIGVSGGVWGLEQGYSLMVGGRPDVVEQVRPALETLAPSPQTGWGHVGPNGAGHFVKMVHNGIEYGMMQAYAEGFAILKAKEPFALDLHQVAEVWRHGTVIRSWLLDLTAQALADDQDLEHIQAWVMDSGEGRWTVEEAIDLAVPAPVITEALYARFRSRRPDNYADRLLAAMRNAFGGHEVKDKPR